MSQARMSAARVSELRMSESSAHEAAAQARTARFGALPERIAFEDMVQEQPALPANQAVDAYDPDSLGTRFSCLAADLGL